MSEEKIKALEKQNEKLIENVKKLKEQNEELLKKVPKSTKLKNIANCPPTKTLAQLYRISSELERWLTETDIMNIRKELPKLLDVPEMPGDEATEEEKKKAREKVVAAIEENDKRMSEQNKKNFFKMVKSILDEHPGETMNLLALCCFVEPEDKDKYPFSDYLDALTDIMNCDSIFDFFASSVRRVLKLSKTA